MWRQRPLGVLIQCYKMGVFSLTSVVSGIFFFFLSNLNFIKEQKLFLSQWVWQGHLVGEQHFCSPALGIISRSCVWAAQRHPLPLQKVGAAGHWLQCALLSPSIHLGFSGLAQAKGHCSEFLCCCGSLLRKHKCSNGKAKWFFIL